MAEPSLLKCNSLAMAETRGERVLLRATLGLLFENENEEEIEARDDKLSNWAVLEGAAANEPTDVIAAKVDAIYKPVTCQHSSN